MKNKISFFLISTSLFCFSYFTEYLDEASRTNFKSNDNISKVIDRSVSINEVKFSDLWSAYPKSETYSRKEFFTNLLKGEWSSDKYVGDNSSFKNTCSLRLSYAFNSIDCKIPKQFKEFIDGKGNNLIASVNNMDSFLESCFGRFYWGQSNMKTDQKNFDPKLELKNNIPNLKGIILYKFHNENRINLDYKGVNGHVDLWDGENCALGCDVYDALGGAAEIKFWKLD